MPENSERRPPKGTPRRGSDRVSQPALRDEVVIANHPVQGRMVLVLPMVPDRAPARIKEGIARRRTTALTGTCPCGATVDYHAAKQGGANVAEVVHTRLCPADDASLRKAIRRWSR